jgi:hypothetical protein
LGIEGFAEGLRHLVAEKQLVREIPKGQRFAGRPALEKLFARKTSDKTTRDELIEKRSTSLVTAKWNWPGFWTYITRPLAEYSLLRLEQ